MAQREGYPASEGVGRRDGDVTGGRRWGVRGASFASAVRRGRERRREEVEVKALGSPILGRGLAPGPCRKEEGDSRHQGPLDRPTLLSSGGARPGPGRTARGGAAAAVARDASGALGRRALPRQARARDNPPPPGLREGNRKGPTNLNPQGSDGDTYGGVDRVGF